MAKHDLIQIRQYIAQDNPTAAQHVARSIIETVERLIDFPASERAGKVPNTREVVIGTTPYIAIYRVKNNIVTILAVIHAAQKRE